MQQANFPSLTPRPTPTMQLQQFQQQHGLGQYSQPRVASAGMMPSQQQMYRPDAGGLGQQYSNGVVGNMGGQPVYRPDMQATGIGSSTPFLSGIQQQLGGMFGQTPGLGFRTPQPQMQAPTPQPAYLSSPGYSQVSRGAMTPMTPWMTQQIQSSPFRNQMMAAGNSMIARGAQ